ncbi:unnamed protein product [marine sediment metagenome]|uniref:Uncharacterized protein n=1 Tax=marine sediment metagenome TaxID=412755 RepID=X1AS36_9ZZZZ
MRLNWLPAAYTDEECRLVSTGGREIKIGAEVVISDWKLFVKDTVTVTEQYRIDNIKLRSTGVAIASLVSYAFEVILVQMRSNGMGEHHKELALRAVK